MQAANCIGVENVDNNEGVVCTSVETDLVQEYLNLSYSQDTYSYVHVVVKLISARLPLLLCFLHPLCG